MKVNIDISCKYFSFLAYQRSVQLSYETLGILIEALGEIETLIEERERERKAGHKDTYSQLIKFS